MSEKVNKTGNLVPTDQVVEQYLVRTNSLILPNFPPKSNLPYKQVLSWKPTFLVIHELLSILQVYLHKIRYVFLTG